MLYVREDIPTNITEVETKPIEGFYVAINLGNDKWLISCLGNDKWLITCSCSPHKNMIGNHLRALSEKLDIFFKL